MAGIFIPGVEVIAGVDGGAFVGAPWRGVLHTTEGPTADGAIATFQATNFWPHFTVDFNARRIVQHLSLDVAARALEVHAVQTNRANCVQLELVGFAADTPTWSSDQIEFIGNLMRAIEARVPIPRQSTVPFKSSPQADSLNNGVRLSANDWLAYSGWCGHQHVAENVHGDPGLIDIGYLCSPHLLGVGSTQSSPGPAAMPRTPYVLDVTYARGNSPFAEGWSGTWDGASTQVGDGAHSPATAAGVALTARRYDVLDAFWVTEQNNLFTSFWTRAQGWSATEAQIGDPAVAASTVGGIAALARQPDILDVFFVGLDNRLHTTWWTADQGWSPNTLLDRRPAGDRRERWRQRSQQGTRRHRRVCGRPRHSPLHHLVDPKTEAGTMARSRSQDKPSPSTRSAVSPHGPTASTSSTSVTTPTSTPSPGTQAPAGPTQQRSAAQALPRPTRSPESPSSPAALRSSTSSGSAKTSASTPRGGPTRQVGIPARSKSAIPRSTLAGLQPPPRSHGKRPSSTFSSSTKTAPS